MIPLEHLKLLQKWESESWFKDLLSTTYSNQKIDHLGLSKQIPKNLSIEERRSISEYLEVFLKSFKRYDLLANQRLLFDKLALEQSTSALISKYKSKLFTPFLDNSNNSSYQLADLCCGMGADSFFISPEIEKTGVDLSPERLEMFKFNIATLGHKFQTLEQDVTQLDLSTYNGFLLDPDRRASGERHFHWSSENMTPSLVQIQSMLKACPNALIKLPPSADPWPEFQGSYEYLGDSRSCSELLLRCGDFSNLKEEIAAVHCDTGDKLTTSKSELKEISNLNYISNESISELQKNESLFLAEPSPVAIRSGVWKIFLKQGCFLLNSNIPYLFSNSIIDSPFLRYWKVIEEVKPDSGSLKKYLKQNDSHVLSIKKRGLDFSPESMLKKLPKKGNNKVILVFFPTDSKGNGTRCLVLKRITF
jgi:hypothetical protein